MNIDEFKNPGSEYRGAPFWSWNDDLDEDELKRQVRLMKEAGLGGFFMHSRTGLITPYMSPDKKTLSEEWMKCIKAAVDEAKTTGMLAYLYDEDRWPSGFAGGIVPAKGMKYKIKVLECREVNGKPGFRVRTENKIAWYNNYSYIDVLDKDAAREFLKSTYQAYYKEVGKEFGKTVPAIFTDEPNYSLFYNQDPKCYYVPWTEKLPDYFRRKNGYDIKRHLISLFYEKGDWKKIRHDYWKAVSGLFLESWTRTIYEWCDKHNIAYTGHYLYEHTLMLQIYAVGAVMPHYEYMHIPGIDHLARQINDIITVKQASSVAHQFGRKRVLSETYGGSGWNLTFESQKLIGDWQYVLGVNLLNQHLALYSMKGCRKRDHPPSLYYQQPWWKYHNVIADYFARLSYMLVQGRFFAKILVIHPIESAWCVYSPDDRSKRDYDSKVEDLNKSFVTLSELLCGLHRDYDFGDEGIIEKYAKVEKGKLKIKNMEYELIILPPLITLRKSTVRVLRKFLKENGKIIAVRPLPYLIDAETSEEIGEIFKNENVYILDKIVLSTFHYFIFSNDLEKNRLKETLDMVLKSDVKVRDSENEEISSIYYQHRIDGKNHIYFFANTNQLKGYNNVRIYLESKGRAFNLNLLNGNISEIPSGFEDGYTVVHLNFPPAGSHLIMVDASSPSTVLQAGRQILESHKIGAEVVLKNKWDIRRLSHNALTIDYCKFKIEDRKFSDKIYVLNAQKELEKEGEGGRFTIRYAFQSKLKTMPHGRHNDKKEIYLVLEQPEMYKIRVNGKEIDYRDIGWWTDISFKKIDMKEFLRYGENTIEISGIFKNPVKQNTLIFKKAGTEIESCYIIGDFAVRHNVETGYYLDEENTEIETGDLVNQGYPFFAGSIILSQDVEIRKADNCKTILELCNLGAVVCRVIINNKEKGLIAWRPYTLDISEFVRVGKNKMEVELTNSNRNLLGPHHNPEGELYAIGPGSFSGDSSANWTDEYSFVQFGLSSIPRLLNIASDSLKGD